jgi:hypothetical protein
MIRFWPAFFSCFVVAVLTGCSTLAGSPPDIGGSPWALESRSAASEPAPWRHESFPGKRPTKFLYTREDGRDAVAVTAASSASMLRSRLRVEGRELGSVNFSWKVPQLIPGADMASRDADDSPVRIVLFFEGDRTSFSPRDALMAELVRAITGEEMPYATLMYVWCNQRAPETVITNPRTDRIRKLVVESGSGRLNQWLQYERDISADFRQVFGELPGPLVGVAIMTDSDNTLSTVRAWYGPLRFVPLAP